MSGQTNDGKPVQVSDQVTAFGKVYSVSLPSVVVVFNVTNPGVAEVNGADSTIQITFLARDLKGPTASGAAQKVLVVGDKIAVSGLCTAVSGVGAVAKLTMQLNRPTQPGVYSLPTDSLVAVAWIPAVACYATMSL